MEVRVDDEERDIEFQGTVTELLHELKLMREEVVIKVNGKLAPETRTLAPDDKVHIIKVVFGG